MESIGQPSLTEALDRLWLQFLPQIEERVATMEAANTALAAGKLHDDQRAAANSAAHKLAGVLGTFGLTKGTILSREAEIIYSGDVDNEPVVANRLSEIAGNLRTLIANRKQD
jgi:HPt (histidine-containing phosphotransfer) domain-containing protein